MQFGLLFLILISTVLTLKITDTEWSDSTSRHYYDVIASIYRQSSSVVDYEIMSTGMVNGFSVLVNNPNRKTTIKNLTAPMYCKNQPFYWDSTSMQLDNVYKICKYRITSEDVLTLRNTVFGNGTDVEFLYYPCDFLYSCDGLECVPPNIGLYFFYVCITLSITIGLVRYVKNKKEVVLTKA